MKRNLMLTTAYDSIRNEPHFQDLFRKVGLLDL